jgi:hypothetical protein
MTTWKFWGDALERAAKTAAQTAASMLTLDGISPYDVDWRLIGCTSGISFVYSLLSSVASTRIGGNASPSLME